MWQSNCTDRGVGRRILAAALILAALCPVASQAQGVSPPADPDLHRPSPDWRDQIVYSLMIDRFEDGDPANNDQGANEYRREHDAYFNGGDLRGITARVPYLKELGATAVWISPPTATQWWDPVTQYSGYHGYWPVHFKQVDAHFGSLEDYKTLSRTLHRNDMYLIQDVVVNQVGHFFNYSGGYDPADIRKNFNLNTGAVPARPLMYPFSLVNLLEPEAAKANIYHWSPSITDYNDPAQQFTHQLQLMNDLNTSNPLVRDALKDSYGFWIREVGVDAFRLDAAKHVEAEFLADFLHGPGGVIAAAKASGRQDFLTFGEIFNFSDPMAVGGELQISRFMGTTEQPQMAAVINFPLMEEMRRVFGRGMPTSYLGYRLQTQADQFASSARWPTFVNNHDVQRFLATGSIEAYHQAYLLMMTAPGIPVIYQGDELGFTDIRRPIFTGPGSAGAAVFDRTVRDFTFLRSIIALRKGHAALRRGTMTVLQDNPVAPGVLAFRREFEGENVYVVLNTSPTNTALLNALPVGTAGPTALAVLYASNAGNAVQAGDKITSDQAGRLTRTLPPFAALVLKAPKEARVGAADRALAVPIRIAPHTAPKTWKSGDRICGTAAAGGRKIQMLIDGDVDSASNLKVARSGQWCAVLPAISLDPRTHSVEFYDPAAGAATGPLLFEGRGSVDFQSTIADPAGDDRGHSGAYRLMTDDPDHHAADLRRVDIRANEHELELTIEVGEIKNVWNYINKFDHAAFTIYIDSEPDRGTRHLPGQSARMPGGAAWDISHRLFGMGSTVHSAIDADTDRFGAPLAGRPDVHVDADRRTITVRYGRAALGIKSWKNVRIYIASWDADEFGRYRPLGAQPSAQQLGGGTASDPHVLDDMFFSLTGVAAR